MPPNKQKVINNQTTGDRHNIIADLKTVLKELHNQTKQRLLFRSCAKMMLFFSILDCDI